MTSSSHLFGENNLVYSNLLSYHHTVYNEDGSLFEGKGAVGSAFDTLIYDDHTSVGNMLVNNTFYNVCSSIVLTDTGFPEQKIYDNIYANNLIVNWSDEVPAYLGAFHDYSRGQNYVRNNAVYSAVGRTDHFVVNGVTYSAEAVNELVGYGGNVYGDPKFLNVDLTLLDKGTRQDFTLPEGFSLPAGGLVAG